MNFCVLSLDTGFSVKRSKNEHHLYIRQFLFNKFGPDCQINSILSSSVSSTIDRLYVSFANLESLILAESLDSTQFVDIESAVTTLTVKRSFYCATCDIFMHQKDNISLHLSGRKHAQAKLDQPLVSKYVDVTNQIQIPDVLINPMQSSVNVSTNPMPIQSIIADSIVEDSTNLMQSAVEDSSVRIRSSGKDSSTNLKSIQSENVISDALFLEQVEEHLHNLIQVFTLPPPRQPPPKLPEELEFISTHSGECNKDMELIPLSSLQQLPPSSPPLPSPPPPPPSFFPLWRLSSLNTAEEIDAESTSTLDVQMEASPSPNAFTHTPTVWGIPEISVKSLSTTNLPVMPVLSDTTNVSLPESSLLQLPGSSESTVPGHVPAEVSLSHQPWGLSNSATSQQPWGLTNPSTESRPALKSSNSSLQHTVTQPEVDERIIDPRFLTTLLLGAQSIDDLRQRARENERIMTALHDSVICATCARLGDKNKSSKCRSEVKAFFLIAAASWIRRPEDSYGKNAKSIHSILTCAAKMHIHKEDRNANLIIDLSREAVKLSRDFNTQVAMSCFSAVVSLQVTDLVILTDLARACADHARFMMPLDAFTTFITAAKVGILDERVVDTLTKTIAEHCRSFNTQEAVQSLLTAAFFRSRDASSVAEIALSCANRAIEMTPSDVAHCLVASAKLGIIDAACTIPLARTCVLRVSDLSPQIAAQSVWAVAKIGLSDPGIYSPLLRHCISKVNELNPEDASNCLWATSALGLSDPRVVDPLVRACVAVSSHFKPQEAANTLVAAALLSITDRVAVNALVHACLVRTNDFQAQDTANNLWAIAKLGISDNSVVHQFAYACVARSRQFSPRDAANALWAASVLSISDVRVIGPLTIASINHVDSFSVQEAINCLWSAAKVGISDAEFINKCVRACVKRIDSFSPQNAAIALWATSVLGVTDFAITLPLMSAVNENFLSITLLDDAEKCLQAHYSGFELKIEALNHFRAILTKEKPVHKSTNKQQAIASSLTRLGYVTRMDVKICNGLIIVDVVIDLPNKMRIAVVYDDSSHFLRPPEGTGAQVGPIDGKTRIRNTLIPRSGYISSLITIPFFDWDDAAGNKEREDACLRARLTNPIYSTQLR
jgi:hypothetical protein